MLSNTVVKAMELRNLPYTKSTEKFISMCDKFFDCLNVNNTFVGQKSRKPALYPYRNQDDWRFKVFQLFYVF